MKPNNLKIDWSQVYADVDEEYSDDEIMCYNTCLSVEEYIEYFLDAPTWLEQASIHFDQNFFTNINYPELIDVNILTFHKRGPFDTCELYKYSFEYYLQQTNSTENVYDLFQFLFMSLQRQKLTCNKSWLIHIIKNFKDTDNFKKFWSRDCARMFGKILKFVGDTEFVYLPYWYSSEKMINLNVSEYETYEPKVCDTFNPIIKYVRTKDDRMWIVKLTFQDIAWKVKAIFPVNEYIERYDILNGLNGSTFTEFLGSCPVLEMFENIQIPKNVKQSLTKTNNDWSTSFRFYNDKIQDSIWKMFT